MSPRHLLVYLAFLGVVTLLVKPMGIYLARVFSGEKTFLDRVLLPIERGLYRLAGIDPAREMDWRQYATAFILFGLLGIVFVFVLLLLQPLGQPVDPNYHPAPLSFLLAFNTAVSFATTTTWQAYSGESALSYLSQALALSSQNFLAGAAGLAVGIAFIRGFARCHTSTVGNFWVDVTRSVLWVLLPIALLGALALVAMGVPQSWSPYVPALTLEGVVQVLPQGPVASLEFIKNLGTNGGGFFGANGAHPFANPSGLSNLLGNFAIVVIPAALTCTFGRMTQRPVHGWLLYGVMAGLFMGGLLAYDAAEQAGNPRIAALGVDIQGSSLQAGGNMEGKETRFGIADSTLTAIATSNGATGSSNAAPDSSMPLGGGVLLFNMMLGESLFGGLGTGLYSLVLTALIAVIVSGLMIGRTPEYLGKTVGPAEMKWIGLHTIVAPAIILPLAALAMMTAAGKAGLSTNNGSHGFTTLLFAYTSCFANNGQTFGGLSADTPFFHVTTVVAMLAGRFGLAIPVLALAGRFAQQGRRVVSAGTLPTDGLLFGGVLTGTLLLVTGLSFLPALAMGPVLEHLQLWH
ncbi:MAG: potassium-transporting ATPase subunit KdpA [Pelomonas sp.]|nr:potassium-transporting ATPase subunit KdpA [Roseateles sp.]MBV8469037.1 potassium-transporting ATPase subunit KdpA [Burkholderiaceae bacterium]MBV8605080.1 potassium-transporting ATPase subunit KdpA [Roseateles sp.]